MLKNKFTILAIAALLVSLCLCIYLLNFFPADVDLKQTKILPSINSIVTLYIAIIVAVIFNVISNIQKEPKMIRWYHFMIVVILIMLGSGLFFYLKVMK